MNKTRRNYVIAAGLFLVFIIYTVIIATVDVQEVVVGTHKIKIGLASLNKGAFESLGTSDFWYSISKYLGYAAILVVGCFGLIGLLQMIQRKNFFRTDVEILVLGAFYVIMGVCYILFEIIVINYRPVLEEGQLEASFPSSHTMLVCCVMGTAILQIRRLVKNEVMSLIGTVLCVAAIALMIVSRLLSGIHWVTDIVGGIIISAALIMLYVAAVGSCKKKLHWLLNKNKKYK